MLCAPMQPLKKVCVDCRTPASELVRPTFCATRGGRKKKKEKRREGPRERTKPFSDPPKKTTPPATSHPLPIPILSPCCAAGSAISRRWVGRRKGRKKRPSTGGRSRRRRAGSRDAEASPSPGGAAAAVAAGSGAWHTRQGPPGGGSAGTGSRSVEGVVDCGSPVRRHSMAVHPSKTPSLGGGWDCGGGGGGGEGDFVGGGHALCWARSRWGWMCVFFVFCSAVNKCGSFFVLLVSRWCGGRVTRTDGLWCKGGWSWFWALAASTRGLAAAVFGRAWIYPHTRRIKTGLLRSFRQQYK